MIERGLVRMTTLNILEIGYSARSAADLQDELHRPPLALMPIEYLTPASESRAMTVQALLAERGLHRAPSMADLLIAASAELTGATLLHMDKKLRSHRGRDRAASRDASASSSMRTLPLGGSGVENSSRSGTSAQRSAQVQCRFRFRVVAEPLDVDVAT